MKMSRLIHRNSHHGFRCQSSSVIPDGFTSGRPKAFQSVFSSYRTYIPSVRSLLHSEDPKILAFTRCQLFHTLKPVLRLVKNSAACYFGCLVVRAAGRYVAIHMKYGAKVRTSFGKLKITRTPISIGPLKKKWRKFYLSKLYYCTLHFKDFGDFGDFWDYNF